MATKILLPRVQRELAIHECHWGRIYTGTREQLLGTGLFQPEWFAKEVKPGRYCFNQTVGSRRVKIARRSKFLLDVYWEYTEKEASLYEDVQSHRKAANDFNRALACLPKSAEEFRGAQARQMQIITSMFLESVGPEGEFRGGYSFATDSFQEINDAFKSLIASIVEARIVYSDSDRQRGLAGLRLKYCGDSIDPAACQFVANLKHLPPAAE